LPNKPAYSTRGEPESKGNVSQIHNEIDLWYKSMKAKKLDFSPRFLYAELHEEEFPFLNFRHFRDLF
jgi:hypothetical protein